MSETRLLSAIEIYRENDARIKAGSSRIPNPFTAAGNFLLGRFAEDLVLQSQSKVEKNQFVNRALAQRPNDLRDERNIKLLEDDASEIYIINKQEVKVGQQQLDTVSICYGEIDVSKSFDLPDPESHIINFCANTETYQASIGSLLDLARDSRANVIAFNYPGAGLSEGRTKSRNDLINAGVAQVLRLLEDGVDPDKITLTGTSLGGAVATMVAKHFQDRGIAINLFNKQSFANLTDVVIGQVRSGSLSDIAKGNIDLASGRDAGLFRRILGAILRPLVKLFLGATQFEMNVAAAYQSLPEENKFYTVARTPLSVRWDRLSNNEDVKKSLKLCELVVKSDLSKKEQRKFLRDVHQQFAAELKKQEQLLALANNIIQKQSDDLFQGNKKFRQADLDTMNFKSNTKINRDQQLIEGNINSLNKAMALILPKDDGTISTYGSLHRALSKNRKRKAESGEKKERSSHKVFSEGKADKNVHMESATLRANTNRRLSDVFLTFHRQSTSRTTQAKDDAPSAAPVTPRTPRNR